MKIRVIAYVLGILFIVAVAAYFTVFREDQVDVGEKPHDQASGGENCGDVPNWFSVEDSGWSVTDASEEDERYVQVSFGSVLKNTSKDKVVTRAYTEAVFQDSDGKKLDWGGGTPAESIESIGLFENVVPGESRLLTGYEYVAATPASVEVEFTRVCYEAAGDESSDRIEVISSDLTIDGEVLSGALKTRSEFDETVDAIVSFVFRNREGEVLSGAPKPITIGGSNSKWPTVSVGLGEDLIKVEFDVKDYVTESVDVSKTTVLVTT